MSVPPAKRSGSIGAVGLVLIGLACQDVGAAFAVLVFPQVGAVGMVALRIVFSALVLLLIARPRLRGHSRADWYTVLAFALALVGMNTLFYLSIGLIPLGTAVAIEVLGPLILAVVTGTARSRWIWAALALVGILLLGRSGLGTLDPVGVALAAGAGVMWAAYILTSSRTGARFPGLDGLALAMGIGAIIILPFGIFLSGGAIFRPEILGLGFIVAFMSSTLPYTLELIALRRLPTTTFSMLLSLGPVVAAAAGFIVLGQVLGWLELLAIVLVVIASAGAVYSSRTRPDLTP
ncbi:EamA family transporter [Mycetocola spongiae]|uniref:EamA family transporter n=1 Tax=Mycetocola spongiae TaxID=2859226 RepID=UPI001CF1A2DB|nr:EamA family transporter [Mycetocola spongiae]UCR89139.1 EamA family transporter [Mycetocola spongiae]